MTEWTRMQLLDMLTEVGAYALEPTAQPTDIERTHGYYVGWRGCIMWLQQCVRERDVTTEAEMRVLIADADRAGESMEHALAFTSEACRGVDDLPEVAVGNDRLRVLLRYARGWQAAAAKADARLAQVAGSVFPDA